MFSSYMLRLFIYSMHHLFMILHVTLITHNTRYFSDMLAKAGERMPLACTSSNTSSRSYLSLTPDMTDRYKKAVYDFLASACGQEYVQDIQEYPFFRKPHASPPLVPEDMIASMDFVRDLYSPGTYAGGGAMCGLEI